MTAPVRPLAFVKPPEESPAWWIHYLNLTISAALAGAVLVHPGWHPPTWLESAVVPLAAVLAVGSGLVFAILHASTRHRNVETARVYLDTQVGALESAAGLLVPLIDRYPALETRLGALETAAPIPAPPDPRVGRLLALLSPAALDSAQTAPGAPSAPQAA